MRIGTDISMSNRRRNNKKILGEALCNFDKFLFTDNTQPASVEDITLIDNVINKVTITRDIQIQHMTFGLVFEHDKLKRAYSNNVLAFLLAKYIHERM